MPLDPSELAGSNGQDPGDVALPGNGNLGHNRLILESIRPIRQASGAASTPATAEVRERGSATPCPDSLGVKGILLRIADFCGSGSTLACFKLGTDFRRVELEIASAWFGCFALAFAPRQAEVLARLPRLTCDVRCA